MSFAIFDENYYLANNPDVKAAVDAGAFSSGSQHFQQTGLAEGRVLVSPFFDEQLYLRKYPDVAAVVSAGAFRSGLQHYIQSGEAEGLSPGAFNEEVYLLLNPDVAADVDTGAFSSGLQHYSQNGQVEEDNRIAMFSGTTGNDVITSEGKLNNIAGTSFRDPISGVDVKDPILDSYRNGNLVFQSNFGVGEVDTLIGGAGSDLFVLGALSPIDTFPGGNLETFYAGDGSSDYALIRGFERGKDAIELAGNAFGFNDYNLQEVNGSLNISTSSGDLIGIVEGVTYLSELIFSDSFKPGLFEIG